MLKFSGYPYLIRGQNVVRFEGGCLAEADGRLPKRTMITTLEVPPNPPLLFRPVLEVDEAQHQAKLEGCDDARTGMPLGMPRGAMCVQRFDDSLNSAIHITYRILLRSSSMPEPRDPLLKVLIIAHGSDITDKAS